jgi:hypothetical protein
MIDIPVRKAMHIVWVAYILIAFPLFGFVIFVLGGIDAVSFDRTCMALKFRRWIQDVTEKVDEFVTRCKTGKAPAKCKKCTLQEAGND